MLWTRCFCKMMHINFLICFHKQRGLACSVLSDMDWVSVCPRRPWSWISLVWAWARACRSRWGSCSSCCAQWHAGFPLGSAQSSSLCQQTCGPTRRVSCAVPSLPWLPWRAASAVTAGGGPEAQPRLVTVSEGVSLPTWAEFLPLFVLFLVLVLCRALLEDLVWGNAQFTLGQPWPTAWQSSEAAQPSWFRWLSA